ncbi:MAG: LamG domain-containing protein, partial [Kiritimatiellaeota bacterium]|nr:LamG domain-containing protein [Kiritimatiellota bacterium]
ALTYHDGDATLYINGAPANDAEFTDDVPAWFTEIVALGFDVTWQGDIADVRFYDMPLDSAEVTEIFMEAEDFVMSLASGEDTADTAAATAVRALRGDVGGQRLERAVIEEITGRGGLLRDGAVRVNPSSLFQILTPMEK